MYIKRESSAVKESIKSLTIHYNFSDYPESLKKKVILLQHFKSYLDGVKFEVPCNRPYPAEEYDNIFLKKWRRAKKAILFRLSNKVIQVIFQDLSELILSSGSGNVTFITSKREVKSTPLYVDLEKKDPSLYKRLNYAKEILVHMINPVKAKEVSGDKENKYRRDNSCSTRAKGMSALSKLDSMVSHNNKSIQQTQGFVTSRVHKPTRFDIENEIRHKDLN